jgi:hypothetical protein
MWHRVRRHGAPLALLAVTTAVWLWPVLSHLRDVVPGAGGGDNLTFVWNLWWMRVAVRDAHYSFLQCPLIFHPFGVNLALHTHTALPAFLAAVLAPASSLLAAQNVLIALHLFLNCAVAYALAYSIARHVGGALVAAIVFGWSPYVSAHLLGHFNLIAAWVLPLIALFALRALNGERISEWLLGASLAIAAYVDYYYAAYSVLLVALMALTPAVSFAFDTARPPTRWQCRVAAVLLAVLAIDLVVIVAIAWTGGTVLRLGGTRVSLLSITNPLSAGWILLGILALVWWAPAIQVSLKSARLRHNMKAIVIPAVILIVAAMPLLLSAFQLWRAGDYVTQRYYWRSAPRGIDTATLLLGNPYGLVTGSITRTAYQRLGIDPIEQVGWLGPGVIVLCAIGMIAYRQRADAKILLVPAAVFLTWSLGPYLMTFGRSTGMILPATAIRFVPLVSNARIPGRAFIVVYMAAAILCAFAVASLARSTSVRRRAAAFALAALVVVDYAPAPPPTFAPGHPAPYDAIDRAGTAGAVLELPLGLRDGFGETGDFDSRVLYYQSFHERPILGGFVARLAPSVLERYRGLPIVSSLLRLSGGSSLSDEVPDADRQRAGTILEGLGVRYVVINLKTAPPDLLTYAGAVLPIRALARDEERIVYEVIRGTP